MYMVRANSTFSGLNEEVFYLKQYAQECFDTYKKVGTCTSIELIHMETGEILAESR